MTTPQSTEGWEESFNKEFEVSKGRGYSHEDETFPCESGYCGTDVKDIKSFIQSQITKAREEESKRRSNLGFIRQYLGELPDNKTVTAKELWKIFNAFAPLLIVEQERELVESLKKLWK